MRNRRANNLRHRYGIEQEDYDRMLEEQDGCCHICGDPPTKHRLSVDHCHETGTVRGLLCHNCNHGLGKFKDKITLLLGAVKYLLTRGN